MACASCSSVAEMIREGCPHYGRPEHDTRCHPLRKSNGRMLRERPAHHASSPYGAIAGHDRQGEEISPAFRQSGMPGRRGSNRNAIPVSKRQHDSAPNFEAGARSGFRSSCDPAYGRMVAEMGVGCYLKKSLSPCRPPLMPCMGWGRGIGASC